MAQGSGLPIWVKAGTYKPHASDRDVSFMIGVPVAIYGGFAGTETDFEERDVAANPTILDGDLEGNDQPDFGSRSDNSYHVVFIEVENSSVWGEEAFVVLDGLIIRGGNADPEVDEWEQVREYRGGVLLDNGYFELDAERRLVIQNATIEENMAARGGGGIGAADTFVELRDTIIAGNLVTGLSVREISRGGGGMRVGPLRATGVRIEDNRAIGSDGGGAILGSNLSIEIVHSSLVNVLVLRNRAGDTGGGLFIEGPGTAVTNCLLAEITWSRKPGRQARSLVSVVERSCSERRASSTRR